MYKVIGIQALHQGPTVQFSREGEAEKYDEAEKVLEEILKQNPTKHGYYFFILDEKDKVVGLRNPQSAISKVC